MLRFFRIMDPKNTKPSFPRLKFTNCVFVGCSVRPGQLITSPIRRSASLTPDSVPAHRHEIIGIPDQNPKLATPRRP
jgi:hypothetical protein